MRKHGFSPDPHSTPAEPLHIQKKELRQRLSKATRQLAIKRNPDKPDYAFVAKLVACFCDSLNDEGGDGYDTLRRVCMGAASGYKTLARMH